MMHVRGGLDWLRHEATPLTKHEHEHEREHAREHAHEHAYGHEHALHMRTSTSTRALKHQRKGPWSLCCAAPFTQHEHKHERERARTSTSGTAA